MWKNTFFLFLWCSTSLASRTEITRYEPPPHRHLLEDEAAYAWVSPFEIMDHLHTLSRLTGAASPRNIPGYSHAMARQFHRHLSTKAPQMLEHIVNLGEHYRGSNLKRKLDGREWIPNVAGQRKRDWQRAMEQQPSLRFLAVEAIDTCPAKPGCEHDPCTKDYLEDPYKPKDPAYGGTGGYTAAVASIKSTKFWSGNAQDRTNADGYSANLIALKAAQIAKEVNSASCDGIDDDIKICILCVIFEIPQPGKFICEVFDGVLKIAELILDSFKSQMDYQDGLVQAAEIEASYEHTRNLLHKQCAIFDESVCRCSENSDGHGLGCDGLDSNCDDEVDDCGEDKVPPTIDVGKVLQRCGGYFKTLGEAENCVLNSVVATDDCQAVEVTVTSQGNCGSATVTITAKEKLCLKSTSVIVPVFVDSTAPVTSCSFGSDQIRTTGPQIPKDVGFTYDATDNCGKPMNVTVDIYSSEIEVLSPEDMSLFFLNGNTNDAAELYLQSNICETASNGRCIKDPAAQDARLYIAIVSATDAAGNYGQAECQIKVIPQGNLAGKLIDTANSTQRFHLASYTSLWEAYN